MDLESPTAFFRRLVTRRTPPVADDPANLGTTFGLEASLGPVSPYPLHNSAVEPASHAEEPMTWLARRLPRRP